jgi:hypothetical protein
MLTRPSNISSNKNEHVSTKTGTHTTAPSNVTVLCALVYILFKTFLTIVIILIMLLSSLENRDKHHSDRPRWPRDTLYPQTLAPTSPTSGGRSVGIVR